MVPTAQAAAVIVRRVMWFLQKSTAAFILCCTCAGMLSFLALVAAITGISPNPLFPTGKKRTVKAPLKENITLCV